jgi:hypothetical protein
MKVSNVIAKGLHIVSYTLHAKTGSIPIILIMDDTSHEYVLEGY